jgi:hypothetical protein
MVKSGHCLNVRRDAEPSRQTNIDLGIEIQHQNQRHVPAALWRSHWRVPSSFRRRGAAVRPLEPFGDGIQRLCIAHEYPQTHFWFWRRHHQAALRVKNAGTHIFALQFRPDLHQHRVARLEQVAVCCTSPS